MRGQMASLRERVRGGDSDSSGATSNPQQAGRRDALEDGYVDLWESVVMWLFGHFGGLTGAVLPPVRRIAQEVVWEIARDGVPLNDEDRHRAAFFRIQRRAIDAQIPWAPHVINLAIELAVADLKRHGKKLARKEPPPSQQA